MQILFHMASYCFIDNVLVCADVKKERKHDQSSTRKQAQPQLLCFFVSPLTQKVAETPHRHWPLTHKDSCSSCSRQERKNNLAGNSSDSYVWISVVSVNTSWLIEHSLFLIIVTTIMTKAKCSKSRVLSTGSFTATINPEFLKIKWSDTFKPFKVVLEETVKRKSWFFVHATLNSHCKEENCLLKSNLFISICVAVSVLNRVYICLRIGMV